MLGCHGNKLSTTHDHCTLSSTPYLRNMSNVQMALSAQVAEQLSNYCAIIIASLNTTQMDLKPFSLFVTFTHSMLIYSEPVNRGEMLANKSFFLTV